MHTRDFLAANLKRLLKKEKLNQTTFINRFRQLTDVPRCSRSHFSRVMKGTRVPTLDLLDGFALVLRVHASDLLGDPAVSPMALDRYEAALVECLRRTHKTHQLLALFDCDVEAEAEDSPRQTHSL
jgi:transcriptional regulator with XRE-family HTH domain